MTVTTTNVSSNGTGDGSNVTFPYTFRFMDDDTEMVVTVAGVTKTLGVDYTIVQDTDGVGGNVVFTSAPANGAAVVMNRVMRLTQEVAQQVDQPPQELENIADKLTMLIQQVQALISAGGLSGPGSSIDNSIVLWSGTGGTAVKDSVALGSSGQVLTSQGAGLPPVFASVAGTGTVTNVARVDNAAAMFTTTITNPTTTPNLQFDLANAAANTVWGNATGGTGAPSYGSIVSGQFGSNKLDTTHGGTGQDWSAITAGRIPYFSSTGVLSTLAVGTNGQVLTLAAGVPTWAAVGAGTVTSVASNNFSPLFTVGVANATTTPTLSFTAVQQNANLVFASGTAGPGTSAPAFRSLINADLPTVDQSHGGTGLTGYSDGNIIVANASGNLVALALGTNGQVLSVNTANNPKFAWTSVGSGTVTTLTKVDNASAVFTTSITNPTTIPEITFALTTANANKFLMGPTNGAAAAPTYRSLDYRDFGFTAAGDLLVVNNTPALAVLPLGANGTFLSVNTAANPQLEWTTPSGSGDVVGPGSATNRTVALFDGTTGKLLKNGPSTLTDGLVLSSKGTGADPVFQIAAVSGGGTGQDWSAQTAGRLPYFTGTGVLGTLSVGTNGQVLTLAAGVPTWATPAAGGTVSDFSSVHTSVAALFTTSVANSTTTPQLTHTLANAAAYTVWGNNTSASAAPGYQAMTLGQMLGSASRSLPTSGTISSGTYYHIGNWASTATGGTFSGLVKIYCTGTFTLSHTGWTVATHLPGGQKASHPTGAGSNGCGIGCGNTLSAGSRGPQGGAFGGTGGAGGISGGTTPINANTYGLDDQLCGSGGAGGYSSGSSNGGGDGGAGGGGLYIYAQGAIAFNESLSANGGNGGAATAGTSTSGGAGGSGGGMDINSATSITVAASKTLSCNGGNGGVDFGTGFGSGGGGGGRIRLTSPSNTVSGSLSVVKGTAGVGDSAGSDGADGTTEQITATPMPRFF